MRQDEGTTLLYTPRTFDQANDVIFALGAVQAITSFMLVVGFLVNKSALIIKSGWREKIFQNQIDMVFEKKELQILRKSQLGELRADELDIKTLRKVLLLEGPDSVVFHYDEDSDGKRKFGSVSMYFEYYWICLTFLAQSGEMIFNVMYFVFSIQGLLQSPVFYSFHLLDVVNRFEALQDVI